MTLGRRSGFGLVLIGLLVPLLALLSPDTSSAAPTVPFTIRFQTNDNGAIASFGNNLLTCPAAAKDCDAARAGTKSLNNNSFAMVDLDQDGVAGTHNSSMSRMLLPDGATVLWAGLYWGARQTGGTGGSTTTDPSGRMSLRVPGAAGYTAVTSEASFGPTSGDRAYQEFANVTDLVSNAGPGPYWGANVAAGTGEDRYAGWSIVVAYRSPDLPLRNLTVFDGFNDVGQGNPQTIEISGFRTPKAGPVETQLGMIAYEGDFGASGDQAKLNDTLLSTSPLTKSNNFFNGTNDDNGSSVQTRDPADLNMLGYDRKNLGATGIPNNATSATLALSSTGDRFFPGVVTTAINLYAPDFSTSSKTVSNLDGGDPADPGDTLEYTLTYNNTGQDPATSSIVTDPVPVGTQYVPGSLRVFSGPNAGAKTDAAGDDQGEFLAGQDAVRFRLGTGANAANGGTIGVGATTQVRFRVTALAAAGGTTVTNSAPLDYRAATLDLPFTYRTNEAAIAVRRRADLSLTKTSAPDPVQAGNVVTSTLTVSNNGPNAAQNAELVDTLPSGPTFLDATPSQGSCTNAGHDVTCLLGDVANGDVVTVVVRARVPADSTGTSFVNVATTSSPTSDPDPDNNGAGSTVAVNRSANLVVSKTVPAGPFPPGSTIPFTVTVSNQGPSDAVDTTLTDVPGSDGLTIVANDSPGICGSAAQCSLGHLAAGDSRTITFQGQVDPDFTGAAVSNTASAISSVPDPDPAAAIDTVTVPIAPPEADITIEKSADASTVTAGGGEALYRITVANPNGPSVATGVTVSDPLPAGFRVADISTTRGTCTSTPPPGVTVTCDIGRLPVGGDATILVSASVDPDAPLGDVPNTATLTADTNDPNPGDNSGTVTITVVGAADLGITKTGTPVVAGQNVTYTLTVSNAGPSFARNVDVTDRLPAEFPVVSATGPGGACTTSGQTVSCPIGVLADGATTTVTVVAAVPPDFGVPPGPTTATDEAEVDATTSDPDPDDNSASFTSSTQSQADLSVTKTGPATAVAGGQVTYTIVVRNPGPSAALATVVRDALPNGVTFVSATAPCTAAGQTVTCNLGTFSPVDSPRTLTIVGSVDPDAATGTIANTATVESTTFDPTDSNNSDTVTTDVTAQTDLAITKTLVTIPPTPQAPGQVFAFVIQVTNDGPSTAHQVSLIDRPSIPLGLDIQQGPITEDDCTITAEDIICALADTIAPGETVSVVVAAVTLPDQPLGTYNNTVRVTADTPEEDETNNQDTADFTLGAVRADVGIEKVVTPDPLVAGTPFSYTLTPTNLGESTASNVVVTDTLPDGLTPTDVQSSQGTCTISGQTVSCQVGDVIPKLFGDFFGINVTIVVSGVVASNAPPGSVTNTATITTTTPDPGPTPNSASVTTDVIRQADLSITKVADDDQVPAGANVGYTVVVTNSGPSAATGAAVLDDLPNVLTVDPTQTDASCLPVTSPLTCDLGTLAAGDSVAVRVVGALPPGTPTGSITNTASVTSTSDDPDETNNTSEPTSVEVTHESDLSIAKTADVETAAAGATVRYTVTVSNAGPSTARDVIAVDPLADGFDATVESADPPLDCVVTAGALRCEADQLPPGQTVSATVAVTIPETAAVGDLVNTARVEPVEGDPDPTNNAATATVNVFAIADTEIVKRLVTKNPRPGQRLTFALDVVNLGPHRAPGVTLSDSLAPGLTFLSASVTTGTGACALTRPEDVDIVTCEVGTLDVGQHAQALVSVRPDKHLTDVHNAASVGSGAQDKDSDDNSDRVAVSLTGAPPQSPTSPAPPTGPTTPTSPTSAPTSALPTSTSPPSSGFPLPGTGAPPISLTWGLLVGGVLVALGGALLTVNRRRRSPR